MTNVNTVFDFSATLPGGTSQALSDYDGKVLLIVNTASKCGFTPQYQGLEELHKALGGEGLVVLGFPCNQFGGQEPGSNDDIAEFCELNYGVSFPIFDKVEVNGDDAHPLFAYLKSAAPGLMGSERIKWNFTKFLVSKDGSSVTRYAPKTTPQSMEGDIQKLLSA
ncbi:MAG: glutathione peroxidase [Lysobacterales bacterium]